VWKTLLQDYLADLSTQKTRAFLTMFAVAWGTLAIVILLSFGEGLKVQVTKGLTNAYDRMLFVWGGATSRAHEGLPRGRPIRLVEEDLELLRRTIPEIDLATLTYGRSNVRLEVGKNRATTYIEAVQPDFGTLRNMVPQAGGRFLNEHDLRERRRVVFLGDEMKDRLFGGGGAVGETVVIDGLPFTVIGVMQPKFQTSNNNGPDAERAIIPASTFRSIYGPRFIGSMLLRPADIGETAAVKRRVYEVLGRKYKFHPDDDRAVRMWDIIEEERLSRAIGTGIQLFLGFVGAFTLIVAGVGVANVMYVVVKERTREIGIRKAMGARRRHIVLQFVFEAVAIALTGGLLGLALGVAIVLGVAAIPGDNMAMQMLMKPRLSMPIGLATVAILCGVGLAAGFFPVRRAALVDPVASLRYE
jgi:putative ABC transport system permease protein